MNRELLTFAVFVLAVPLAMPAFSADRSQDEAAIHKVETGLQEAWNRHDAQAFASFFTGDADCLNVVGWWWKGRPQIEKKVADAHVFMFRDSILTNIEIHIRFLSSRMAVVHVRWSMVGNRNPDGTPGQPREGIQTHILQKQAGKWLIAVFNNNDSIPEVPFPTGPAKD
jgi:uncharacterized protein (TIGR02246 family)